MNSPNNRPDQDAPRARRWGLGFSPASAPVLDQLLQAGLIDSQVATDDQITAGDCLVEQWSTASGFVIVGAASE